LDVPTLFLFGIDVIRFSIDLATAYGLYLIVSLTLNLEAGFTGIPNFGKVLFVAAGAAAVGFVCGRLAAFVLGVNTFGDYNGHIQAIIPPLDKLLAANPVVALEILFAGLAIAATIGAVLGLLTSYPAIRLREDYLGMLLLAAAQLFQIFLGGYEPLIGGSIGISVPDFFGWAGNGIEVRDVVVLGFVAVFAAVVYLYMERVARSPLGRTLRSIRDNEMASRALGKRDAIMRRNVIIVASAISAMAGALLAFYVGSVTPETWTRITWTFWIWVMLIVGGAGNNAGVALGAFAFTFLFKITDQVKFYFQGYIPFDVNWLEYLTFAALLILIIAYRPGGILPEKSSVTLPWKTLAEIMQSKPKRSAGMLGPGFASESENVKKTGGDG
jgi:branched-chain amino acid transport system permease protein